MRLSHHRQQPLKWKEQNEQRMEYLACGNIRLLAIYAGIKKDDTQPPPHQKNGTLINVNVSYVFCKVY